MFGLGMLFGAILKIATTVAVLAAAYFFLLKPVLDTTNNAFEQFGVDIPENFGDLPEQVQGTVEDALDGIDSDAVAKDLKRCIERAGEGKAKQAAVERCVDRFGS